ncbi:gastrula zinc finger protein xFG20-1-like [Lucilia cuprina]|uniref:gastrula zinc finger protein xFG20-1-like n=1 Tax=Lucilia cuprina TaxID=7375 RepID=UPI001F05A074|nr:gastrula zinc finger protein xFG20-1-like [Lucilia cuprina]
MSAIVIKTEKDEECEDVKPVIKEGGGIVIQQANSGVVAGGNNVRTSAVATGGPKEIVEKTQAALKVANEAKQLNLRLKEPQKLLQQQTTTNTLGKRSSSIAAEQLHTDNSNETTNLPYKVGNKRFRVQTPVHYAKKVNTPPPPAAAATQLQPPPPAASAMAPAKCGEIFVTNNARKWTFVCTFCQKSTRDIGEFVCHIKFKHMPTDYQEDEDYEEDVNDVFVTGQEDNYNNHEQDYFDCTNYLDVNVHTESDELPPQNNGVKAKLQAKLTRQSTATSAAATKDQHKRQMDKSKYIVDLLDDDEDQEQGRNTNEKDMQQKNDMFDYEMEEDEDGVEIVDDDNDEMEPMEEDNLLFLRSSSIEDANVETTGVKGSSKKYRSHVRGKAYCNLCDKTFQYYSLYRNHMIKHSNITPYKCQYCSKAFKSKQAIRYHMNTHTKEVQYTCPLCPMTYGTENQFITHVLNHESDTCFPCMVCAKILKSDQERDEHLSTHSEERPFPCGYCNKRFRQKHHLSNHLKLHCQYRCDFCKEEFSSTQTQRRPYACASCEEYPEIRIQVEKQRSKNLNNEVNPLELSYDNMPTNETEATECVDLATDDEDEESENSTSLLGGANGQKRISCQYCPRSYKQTSALNYHIRQKHPQIWAEMKVN